MDERVVAFIAALRAAGVRVSLAESADAFRAVQALGVADREIFRTALRATLVKEQAGIASFDSLFPLFFSAASAPPLPNLSEELSQAESEQLSEVMEQLKERLQNMLERLMQGRPLTREELERLARMVGLNQASKPQHREWMNQRMQRALGLEEIRQFLREFAKKLADAGFPEDRAEQLVASLQASQYLLGEQINQFVGQRIAENMTEIGQKQDPADLLERPFGSLSDEEIDALRKQTRRLANALRTSAALRQKHTKSGHLDPKATIRANIKHGNVPIDLRHRDRTLKPRLVVLCDISTSMRAVSEFMLGLLHSLQDQISKTHAFAFIDHLEYISPDLEAADANTAVHRVLARMPSGYYNTDLGWSLQMFFNSYLDLVDSRTTLIIVGDGRNNYNNPQLEILQELNRRVRRIIWLNPEPRIAWGSGDSDMLAYEPLCSGIYQVSNMSQLTAAVDRLLE